MADKFGLIGKILGHSFSPEIHKNFGDYEYELIEVAEERNLEAVIFNDEYKGFNVTIPYKKSVIKYCDEITEKAKLSGAVNTIYKDRGRIIGDNTDVDGFTYLLNKVEKPDKVLILGSGGAHGAVKVALEKSNVSEIVTISRSGENNYKNLDKNLDADLIINTTPVGMYPNNGESPIDIKKFRNLNAVIDIVYNPYKTKLLLDAEKKGIKTISGLGMLVAQAKAASELWQGVKLNDNLIDKVTVKLLRNTQNIVLIGMPGSGKSSIAKIMGRVMKKPCYDLDKEIVKHMGKTVHEIFNDDTLGESAFRDNETEVFKELSKRTGIVIATGGGTITREENWPLIKQNGVCVYVKRDVKLLPTKGRPLSQRRGVEVIFNERAGIYESLADIVIENNRIFKDSYFTELYNYVHKVKKGIDKYYNNL
ncbi:MAG: shikimate kinase [Peptostreptococcaceae bacterium]|nr:shikimate kinase [Peptostreptococcaceae bacterium]